MTNQNPTTRYKFLQSGYASEFNSDFKYKVGRWYKHDGKLKLCKSGFHCSKGVYQAFSYVQGSILCQVEVKGKSIKENDKEVWKQMRIIKSWKWTKKDSVMFAIYAAKLVIGIWEKKYPNDKRPQKAIGAAQAWLKNPTKKNRAAARAAGAAARAAGAAARAAGAAAWAAGAATWAARAATWAAGAAAWAAGDAAWAAGDAAWAARAAIYKKLDKWMLNHLKNLKILTKPNT